MIVFSILAASFIMNVIAVFFIFCAVALILIILIQKGKGGGLGAAFGGGLAGGILGTKTGDFLTWVTIGLVSVFLMLAVIMAKFYKPAISDFGADQATVPSVQQESPTSTQPMGGPEEQIPIEDFGTATDIDTTEVNLLDVE
ncbi:MAG: preprotein translocase subunit SecG [Planctomycetota bacterium]|nr:MAG: preprotein translocase subunit SecG [Planctomycetota bacterium]